MRVARSNNAKTNNIFRISELLDQIDPDLSYGEWVKVLMAVFYETNGDEEGFEIADSWCSRGRKYPGSRDIRSKWNSFSLALVKPVTMGTLIWMARQQP